MIEFVNQNQHPRALALHQKYAKSLVLLDLVWTHCNIVADIVQQLLSSKYFDSSSINIPHAIQAALLHDIGVYCCGGFEWIPDQTPSEKPYIQHVVTGAKILQKEGLDPVIVEAAYTHTGVGLTAQDIQNYGLNLPVQDLIPQTIEGQLVGYAAKFHSKTPKFKSKEHIIESLNRYGKDKVEQFNKLLEFFGEPNLEKIKSKYEEWHKAFAYKTENLTQTGQVNLNSAGIN
ncbi:MAG: HDIG domain-containing metalloprotein [Patescibacteria group bacterium]